MYRAVEGGTPRASMSIVRQPMVTRQDIHDFLYRQIVHETLYLARLDKGRASRMIAASRIKMISIRTGHTISNVSKRIK